jgi:outer membrane protein assembly factor BamA
MSVKSKLSEQSEVSAKKLRKHIDLKINKPLNEEELEKGRQKIIDIYQAARFHQCRRPVSSRDR